GVFIFLGLWSGGLKAQQLTYKKAFISDEYSKAIQSARSLVDSLRKAQHIPGVEVAVSVKGQKEWSQGFGYADLENKVPVWPTTKMRIGSVSKTLTSAALGKLIEEHKLDVDRPVRYYVPEFPQKEKGTITTRMLGGQQSGIRHYRGDEFRISKHYESLKEGLKIFM